MVYDATYIKFKIRAQEQPYQLKHSTTHYIATFLAPTGAQRQGLLCLPGTNLSKTHNLHNPMAQIFNLSSSIWIHTAVHTYVEAVRSSSYKGFRDGASSVFGSPSPG